MDAFMSRARELDEADDLADFRKAFLPILDEVIYLDGNSLGPLPRETLFLMEQSVTNEWGRGMIRSWNNGWFDLPDRLGDKLAPLVGAEAGEVIFCDSVTVNSMKLITAALRMLPERGRIVTDSLNFPSNFYAMDGLCTAMGQNRSLHCLESPDGINMPLEAFEQAINEETALVTVSHVTFKSGFMHDLRAITELAHSKGALVLADLSHSVGSVLVRLNEWGVDMAVGCSYKYLNGGPGAPAFLFVRKGLIEELPQVLTGWMGSAEPFDFARDFSPAPGIRRFLLGTPPILSMRAMEPALNMLLEAGMEKLREKSLRQAAFLLEMWEALLQPHGFELGSPTDPERRGSHISFRHPEAYRINKAMISPQNGCRPVIPDFRRPDNLRLGIAPLYLKYNDIYETMIRIATIVETREYTYFSHASEAVT